MKLESTGNNWKWRDDEITMREFYKLSSTEKDEYILLILGLKEEERSSMDEILLNRFGRTKKVAAKFLEL